MMFSKAKPTRGTRPKKGAHSCGSPVSSRIGARAGEAARFTVKASRQAANTAASALSAAMVPSQDSKRSRSR